MAVNEHGLEPMQEAFCEEFIIDLNQTQAAIRAGYEETSARVAGARLLSKDNIRARIDQLKKERTERTLMKADDVLNILHSAANIDPSEFFDEDGIAKPLSEIKIEFRRLITGIKQTKFGTEFTLFSKEKAVEMTARHHSLFNDKSEVTIKDETVTPEDRAARIAELQKKLTDAKAVEGGK